MVEIVNTLNHMDDAYDHEQFKLNKWLDYIQPILCGDMNIFLEDMIQSTTICGYSFEKDYLPVLNNAYLDSKKRNRAIASFEKMTDHLEEKIKSVFGRSIDARVVLYLGLCNGAGWACEHGGKQTVYLGIEKIIELDWTSEAKMAALIYHELGHLYQKQYGILEPESENLASVKLWQLFTEGIAMVFEQKLMGDDNFFHQDTDGWLLWCERNNKNIKTDFEKERGTAICKQRYFGDWVDYEGHGDVGYYLGTRFVRWLLQKYPFDELISITPQELEINWRKYLKE